MADVLMAFDEQGYNSDLSKLNAMKDRVSSVVAAYNAMGLPGLSSTAELRQIFSDPKGLVFDKITGGNLTIGGATIDRSKAIDIITKPVGYEEFLQAIKASRQQVGYGAGATIDPTAVVWSAGAVALDSTLVASLQESYKSYAKTAKQKKVFEQTTIIANALNEIANTPGITGDHFKSNADDIARFLKDALNPSNTGNSPNAKQIASRFNL